MLQLVSILSYRFVLWVEGSIQMWPHCKLKIAYYYGLRTWIFGRTPWTDVDKTFTILTPLLMTGRLSGPFRQRQVTIVVIIIALWIQCELMSCTRETLVGALYHPISVAAIIARSPILQSILRYRPIDMNPNYVYHITQVTCYMQLIYLNPFDWEQHQIHKCWQ